MLSSLTNRRRFSDLSEQEILALAISSEEDDARIYLAYADGLRDDYPASAKVFEDMAAEETTHRARLIDLHKKRFGDRIPLIRRDHVLEKMLAGLGAALTLTTAPFKPEGGAYGHGRTMGHDHGDGNFHFHG